MTIHYHGGPLTPFSELQTLAGKCFCISYGDWRNLDWYMKYSQSIMWDNGAYIYYTSGATLDIIEYYKWLEDKLGHPHWAVVPDVIGGNEQLQRELVKTWPFSVNLGAPVWHLNLSIDYLLELVDTWPKVCFGSSAEYWKIGSPDWDRRVDIVWNALAKTNREPWIHMLRGIGVIGKRWPFASADSANVARNYRRNNVSAKSMVEAIDSIQSPVQWKIKSVQRHLF